MQTLHQELEPSTNAPGVDVHPTLRGLMADQATAYAEEVRALRQRVAALESELAATKVATQAVADDRTQPNSTSTDEASSPAGGSIMASEFEEAMTPAVVAVAADMHRTAHECPTESPAAEASAAAPTEAPSDPGFAEAWTADDSPVSFEERIAARAFFQASTVDEESRTWLLAQ